MCYLEEIYSDCFYNENNTSERKHFRKYLQIHLFGETVKIDLIKQRQLQTHKILCIDIGNNLRHHGKQVEYLIKMRQLPSF